MKSRTSFSKTALLRKDITRFAPLWAVYGVIMLLIMLAGIRDHGPVATARNLGVSLSWMAIFNMIYAYLCAQLLFGDLFKSRMCNGLHAMPPRREHWFCVHLAAAMLFSFVPNLVSVLTVLPDQGCSFTTVLWWLLGMQLEFLFFFGLAVFCAMCTGRGFAMAALYGMINFAALILTWVVNSIYLPMMPGVVVNLDTFDVWCPIVKLASMSMMRKTEEVTILGFYEPGYIYVPKWECWQYLMILTVVGIVLLGVALLLYRRRKLESAGDFMAIRALNPVFSLVYTFFVGAVFAVVGSMFGERYLGFLFVGITVGYFTGQMLLRRTVKVFQGKTFLRFALVTAAVALSLVAMWFDIFGIVSWTPKASRVGTAVVYIGGVETELSEQEDIAKLSEIHKALINMEDPEWGEDGIRVELRYEMKYGTTVTREYQIPYGDEMELLRKLLSQTNIVLWSKDPEVLHSQMEKIKIGKTSVPEELQSELLEAIIADCEAGLMTQNNLISTRIYANLTIEYRTEGGWTVIVPVRVSYASIHTYRWIEIHKEELGL